MSQDSMERDRSTSAFPEGKAVRKGLIAIILLMAVFIYCSALDVRASSARQEIIFVEDNIADYQTLLSSVRSDIEVHVLDAGQNGLVQIANILSGRSGIDGIHIVTHGQEGALQLGTLNLSTSNLQDYAEELSSIGGALDPDGDILLYGCDVASGSIGADFVEVLAEATLADIAASSNATGALDLGGDWILEVSQGVVSTPLFAQNIAYDGLLPASKVFPSPTDTIFVRPGGTSYTWTYSNGTVPGYSGEFPVTEISYYNVTGFSWILSRGKFQYSSDGGDSWVDYQVFNDNNNFVSVSGKLWRFIDANPADTETRNSIGTGWRVSGLPNSVGSGSSIVPDNAPTDISSSRDYILSGVSQGTAVATLTPTDTGSTTGGFWAIEGQSVPDLFTLSFDSSKGNEAKLQLGSGELPPVGQTATVTVRYYDLYQTDDTGSPVSGQGYSKTLTFTVIEGHTRDLNFGDDLKMNTYTANEQINPSVAALDNGNFVVVWQSSGQDAEDISSNGIYGRLFSSTGTALGSEFAITIPGNDIDETTPVVTALNDGRFVVAYNTTPGTNGLDIAYRIIEADGTVGSELLANMEVSNDQYAPSITTLSDGSFVIVWIDYDTFGVYAQKFNASNGSKQGPEMEIEASGEYGNVSPHVAALNNGEFVVVWGDGYAGNVYAKVSDNLSAILPVADSGLAWSYYTYAPLPRVSGLTGGGFVVAWDSYDENWMRMDILFRMYDNAGNEIGGIQQANVSSADERYKFNAVVAPLSGGDFVIGWEADDDYDLSGIFGRRYTSAGVAIDAHEFEINQYRIGAQYSPAIAALPSDTFVTVWVDATADVTTGGIEGRVLLPTGAPSAPAAPNVTANDVNNTIVGLTTAMEFKVDNGSYVKYTGSNAPDLSGDHTVLVRVAADDTTGTPAGAATTLTFTTNPAAPAAPSVTANDANNTIVGLTTAMEFQVDGGSYVRYTGSNAPDLTGDHTVLVRIAADDTTGTPAGAATTLTFTTNPAAPAAPSVTANDANNTIVGLTTAMEFQVDGGSYVRYTGSNAPDLTGDHTVLVRIAADDTTGTPAGAAATLTFTTNPAAPAAPSVTANDANNTIVGLDTTMEFQVDGGSYVRYTGSNAPDLTGDHTVLVRIAADDTTGTPAGAATTLTFTTNPAAPAAPSVTANDANNTIVGLTTAMEFQVDGGSYVRYTGSNPPDLTGDHTVLVRIAADDTTGTPAGAATTLTFTTNPVIVPTTPSAGNNSDETGVDVLVNGRVESAGKATKSDVGGQSVITITVDENKINARLEAEKQNAVITIPVNSNSDVVVGQLNGQIVKNMEQKQAVIEIRTEKATYTLPAQQININAISGQFGKAVELQDITMQIAVATPTTSMIEVVENAAVKGGLVLVIPPLNFTVTATYENRTIEVSKFNVYIERTIAIPDGVDPNRITTGVVVDPDGTVRHVPTKIVIIDGKYYAKVNSLTNSTYSIVWHPLEFRDVANHWAKDFVNDLGSRMVINGIGDELFNPDQDITRAEFTAIITRGLGLKLEESTSVFTDVKPSDWYSSAVQTAYSYHLIDGFGDGTFRPMEKITREQAMTIIAKAMKITGLKDKLQSMVNEDLLVTFTDAGSTSRWAQGSIADSLQAGIINGRNGTQLAPKAFITRAEVAAIVQRLLQKSELI